MRADDDDDRAGKVRRDHPDTSYESAEAIGPKTRTLRMIVYDYIRSRRWDGATDYEMQIALSMVGSTQRPRRVELVEDGLVMDSGLRRRRAGRNNIVWVLPRYYEPPEEETDGTPVGLQGRRQHRVREVRPGLRPT